MDPPPLRREQVVERLRNAIITGRLKPGDRLIERELCERMGVSRTSIREALRHLEADHLIKKDSPRGLVVARLARKEIAEIYEVRGMLEAELARRFTEVATDMQIATLRGLFQRILATPSDNNPIEIITGARQFTDFMVEVVRHELIGDILDKLHARISVTRVLAIAIPGRVQKGRQELARVIAAIEQRDGVRAATSIAAFVRHAGDAALRKFDENESQADDHNQSW